MKEDMFADLETTHARLSLMLTNDDANHGELRKAIYALLGIAVQDKDERSSSYPETRDAVVTAAQKVIDAEWTKIKQGN